MVAREDAVTSDVEERFRGNDDTAALSIAFAAVSLRVVMMVSKRNASSAS